MIWSTGISQHNLWKVTDNVSQAYKANVLMFLPHSVPSWILSKAENLASPSLQDGATKWEYFLKENHPATHPTIWIFLFAYLTRFPQTECLVSLPQLLNHFLTLCGVPTLIWTSDHITSIGMCGVLLYLNIWPDVPNQSGIRNANGLLAHRLDRLLHLRLKYDNFKII